MYRPTLGVTALVALTLTASSCAAASVQQESHTPIPYTPASVSPSTSPHPSFDDFPLADQLLTGEFAGTSFQRVNNTSLPDLGSVFGHCGPCRITPNECAITGLTGFSGDNFVYRLEEVAGSIAENEAGRVVVMLGFSPVKPEKYTSGPSEYRKNAEECAVATGTTSDDENDAQARFTRRVELQPSPTVEGASDVIATITNTEDGDGSRSFYLIVGNVGDVSLAVQSSSPEGSQETPDVEMANEVFKAQVQRLKS